MRTLERINVKYFKYACDDIGKETPVDINAKCILCGDSEKDKRQKRLHLYTKENYDSDAIKCFNCEWTGNMYSFLREVDSSLFEQYKKETREKSFDLLKEKRKKNQENQNKEKKQEFNDASIQIGNYTRKTKSESTESESSRTKEPNQSRADTRSGEIQKEPTQPRRDYSFAAIGGDFGISQDPQDSQDPEVKRTMETSNGEICDDDQKPRSEELSRVNKSDSIGRLPEEVFELPSQFIPATDSKVASEYLQGRGLDASLYFYSKGWLKFKGKNMPLKNCIIIPLWVLKEDNLKDSVLFGFQARSIDSKFFYTYIPDENSGFKVWNWFGIDKTKPTFIFESAFDAESSGLPLDRVCAALGADLNETRISELSQPIFCLDNQRVDQTSRNKTVDLLKKGYKCFVWDKSMKYKDTNDAIRGEYTKIDMAKYILHHLETGMTGIIKTKLKR